MWVYRLNNGRERSSSRTPAEYKFHSGRRLAIASCFRAVPLRLEVVAGISMCALENSLRKLSSTESTLSRLSNWPSTPNILLDRWFNHWIDSPYNSCPAGGKFGLALVSWSAFWTSCSHDLLGCKKPRTEYLYQIHVFFSSLVSNRIPYQSRFDNPFRFYLRCLGASEDRVLSLARTKRYLQFALA